MSYKVKSLLYFAALVASVYIYDATNTDVSEKSVTVSSKIAKAVSDNSELQAQDEAFLLEEVVLKN